MKRCPQICFCQLLLVEFNGGGLFAFFYVFVLLFFILFDCFSLNEIVFDVRSMVCNHSSMWGSNFISFSFY